MEDYYSLLGVAPDADMQSIRNAWLEKAHRFHPDHNPGDVESHDQFISVRHAYKVLSDPDSRSKYDQFRSEVRLAGIHYGIQARLEVVETGIFHEIRVMFTFTGPGKSFTRPSFDRFFFNSKPFVSVRNLSVDGTSIRETTFVYLIAPLESGNLVIGPASVVISGEKYQSTPLELRVKPSTCAFSKEYDGDGLPLKCPLHLTLPPTQGRFPQGESKRMHTVLVPRSKVARQFHQLGRLMKIVFTLWGGYWMTTSFQLPVFFGLLVGNFLGGAHVHLMYRMVKIMSRRQGLQAYPGVSDYIDVGYKSGSGIAWPIDRKGVLDRLVSMVS